MNDMGQERLRPNGQNRSERQQRSFGEQNWLIALSVLAAVLVLLISLYSVVRIQNSVRAELSSLLTSTLDNTVGRLRAWELVRRRDLEVWATDPDVVSLAGVLVSYGENAPKLMHDEADFLLSPALRAWDGKEYSVVGLNGKVLTSSARHEIGAISAISTVLGFTEHILAGQSRVSMPMHRPQILGPDADAFEPHPFAYGEPGHLSIYVGAPIRTEGGGVIAILVFELDPIADFSTILTSGRARKSMETIAFSKHGMLLSESRYNTLLSNIGLIAPGDHSILNVQLRDPGGDLTKGFSPPTSRAERSQFPLTEMAHSATGEHAGLNLVGYRSYMGHNVIGTWTWLKDLGFGIATEMSAEEAYATYYTARWQIMVASILAAALLVGLSIIFYTGRRRIGEGARRLQSIMDNVLDGIIVINEKGIVETYNASAARIFGYSPEEVIGHNVSMLTPEPHRTAHDSYIQRFLKTDQANILGVGREVTGQRKDGSLFPLDLAVTEMAIHGRRMFLGITRDITERKHSQEILSRSEQSLKTAQRIAKLGGWSWDIASGDLSWSDEVFHIFGYPSRDIEPSYDAFMAAVHPDDREDVRTALASALETLTPYRVEHRIVLPNGSTRVVYEQGEIAVDSWGEPMRMDGIIHDITDRKAAERLKSEFVSTVSHELRTPLTSIHGSLGLLVSGVAGDVSEQCNALLGVAHKNSERLVRLIDDILDVEKLEAGKMAFSMRRHEVDELLAHALEVNKAYADKFNVKLQCTETVPGAEIMVDVDRFAQVMANLISNAVKFSPEGGDVEISASQKGHYIRFSVKDKGPGIPAEFRDRIFNHFTQADASDTRQKGGTGLGLSISKAIVEKMGGSISLLTDKGIGTTFYFELKRLQPSRLSARGQKET